MQTSTSAWQSLLFYYNQNISTIWVEVATKKPLSSWKDAQTMRYSEDELSRQLAATQKDVLPGLVCGEVSGNLEVLDIDIKHWPGIDAIFFTEIKSLYPDLFDRLRIHKTPSGGFHILYRTDKPTGEGNQKLTVKEGHKEAGIETRGEGGYVLAPPGFGYSVHQDRPIPVITIEQRQALIILAKALDQRPKPKKYAPTAKSYSSNYAQNPFQHFNHSTEGMSILLEHGWTIFKETDNITYFTRPGKDTGCSATYIKEKGIFHVFTSSTGLEPDKNYDPTAILAIFKFNSDYKKTFRHLVQQGYGKFTPEYEQRMIHAHVIEGKELPANFSDKAKQEYQAKRKAHEEQYPHGIFWKINARGGYSIVRSELIDVCNALGLKYFRQSPVIVDFPFYEIITERTAYDIVLNYINEDDLYERKSIIHTFDAFWQNSGKYILSRLDLLKDEDVLKSTKDICYKAFMDKILIICALEAKEVPINEWRKTYIDKKSIIPYDWDKIMKHYEEGYESAFEVFLRKAISVQGYLLRRCIGYLCYDWTDETEARIVSLAEEVPSRQGGGSGKGLFCQLLGLWSKVKTTDGMMIKKPELLLQSWHEERILHLNDLPKRVDLSVLKAMVSEGTELKKLYKDVATVAIKDMPKIVISGQYGMNVFEDGGVKRRLEVLSFTGYYNRLRRPTDTGEFGGRLPDCWNKKDWAGYYQYIVKSIQEYMKHREVGLFAERNEQVWAKDFDIAYGSGQENFREWLEEKLEKWTKREEVLGRQSYVTIEELKDDYMEYCRLNNIKREMRMGRVQDALREYCERHGIRYEKKTKKVAGIKSWVINLKRN